MGLGQAGDRIKQKQDIMALVTEMLRRRNRAVRRPLLRPRRFAGMRIFWPVPARLVMSGMPAMC